jgi:hypothetical protein
VALKNLLVTNSLGTSTDEQNIFNIDAVINVMRHFSLSITIPENNICHCVVFSAKPNICESLQEPTQAENCMAPAVLRSIIMAIKAANISWSIFTWEVFPV